MKSQIFKNFHNKFTSPPTPFVLTIYLVSSLEKISSFLEIAVFNNEVALLRCVCKEG